MSFDFTTILGTEAEVMSRTDGTALIDSVSDILPLQSHQLRSIRWNVYNVDLCCENISKDSSLQLRLYFPQE
jgi:hypothetical protein